MKGKGGSRQRLKHIGGDFPLCMRNKGEENELKSKGNEGSSSNRAKGEGGSKNFFLKKKKKQGHKQQQH